ncbi:hypothetical protein KsCSTR_32930 [Candidatus Kuenenia stuttgartiensis]|uniref:Uncharacterized protein n=1 Tax=Kuenenia stuttgartiensis TaxID=174633 RepID=Q1Q4J6_KUEST|nr:hypothetical protein KsCSTR_32930 [Candidatus Kuenenia stuttgartiensis]CAJ74936.1 unknown protein [Candidatus Kuenenia stuttgartiensis]
MVTRRNPPHAPPPAGDILLLWKGIRGRILEFVSDFVLRISYFLFPASLVLAMPV